MTDKETLSVYDSQIETYAGMVEGLKPDPTLISFMDSVGEGGYVLDLGCGPAHHSALMREHGLRVDAVDASPEMVKHANKTHDIGARIATFDDLPDTSRYDGVWASFSLLHVSRADFRRHLRRIHTALKDKGIFHIGMKIGSGEQRDKLGRFYTYYSEPELTDNLTRAGFHCIKQWTGEDRGLAGDVSPWLSILSKKAK